MTRRVRGLPIVAVTREDGSRVTVRGRDAETMLKLVEKGPRGVSAYDFAGGPPFRLAAYVKSLRNVGIAIRTDREDHDCGWHGVFVLESRVRIESGANGAS
jgi:hypothetical protein